MEKHDRAGLTERRHVPPPLQTNRSQRGHHDDGVLLGRHASLQRSKERQRDHLLGSASKRNTHSSLSFTRKRKTNFPFLWARVFWPRVFCRCPDDRCSAWIASRTRIRRSRLTFRRAGSGWFPEGLTVKYKFGMSRRMLVRRCTCRLVFQLFGEVLLSVMSGGFLEFFSCLFVHDNAMYFIIYYCALMRNPIITYRLCQK